MWPLTHTGMVLPQTDEQELGFGQGRNWAELLIPAISTPDTAVMGCGVVYLLIVLFRASATHVGAGVSIQILTP